MFGADLTALRQTRSCAHIGGSARGYQAEGFASSALVSASFGRGSVGQLEYYA
jgi:hypothetical protein